MREGEREYRQEYTVVKANYHFSSQESGTDAATLRLLIHRLVLPYSMSEDATKSDPESVLLEERKEVRFEGGRDSEKLSKLENLTLHEFVVQRTQMILLFQSQEPLPDNKTEAMLVFIDT